MLYDVLDKLSVRRLDTNQSFTLHVCIYFIYIQTACLYIFYANLFHEWIWLYHQQITLNWSLPHSLLYQNQSLYTGIFPEKLKIAKVTPLFKHGEKNLTENYRPISLLASISKIFERVVFNQIYQYFVENNFLFDGQYGFRKHHSTELAALESFDRISNGLD